MGTTRALIRAELAAVAVVAVVATWATTDDVTVRVTAVWAALAGLVIWGAAELILRGGRGSADR
jgi:hypothetical protein